MAVLAIGAKPKNASRWHDSLPAFGLHFPAIITTPVFIHASQSQQTPCPSRYRPSIMAWGIASTAFVEKGETGSERKGTQKQIDISPSFFFVVMSRSRSLTHLLLQ
jgi:hypothetical protein